MVLDTLAETRPNIKRLTLEEPQKQTEILFDPERDISPQDWDAILHDLSSIKESDGAAVTRYYTFAVAVKLLSSERYALLKIDDALWKHMQKSFRHAKNEAQTPGFGSYRGLSKLLSQIKLISPEKLAELYPDINDLSQDITAIKNDLTSGSIEKSVQVGSFAYILTNGESSEIPAMKNTWDYMKVIYNRDRQRKANFSATSANLKIMYPEWFRNLQLGISDWQFMQQQLNELRNKSLANKNWEYFAQHAMNMYILAAERVTVSNQGLEIIMPKPKEDFQEVTPLPEQRRF